RSPKTSPRRGGSCDKNRNRAASTPWRPPRSCCTRRYRCPPRPPPPPNHLPPRPPPNRLPKRPPRLRPQRPPRFRPPPRRFPPPRPPPSPRGRSRLGSGGEDVHLGQEVVDQVVAGHGEYRLRVELHALGGGV